MKYISILIIFFTFASYSAYSQKETYNWHFGYGAGITFLPDGTEAKFLSGGKYNDNFYQQEGAATLSDRAGNLLLYSDGATVWNRSHKTLRNGTLLNGGKGSARSAIIIPRPYSNQYYYIFTIEAHEYWIEANDTNYLYGLRYSVVDMLSNNGDGEVISGQKDISLLDNAVEKMVTINHTNRTDVWLVAYNWKDNNFYTYLITKDGIGAPRKTQRPFASYSGQNMFYRTCFNLDYDIGKQCLIDCDAGHGSFVIYSFDPASGTIGVGDPIVLPAGPLEGAETGRRFWPYSGVFSGDGKKFYGSCYWNSLLQYDFDLPSTQEIIASRKVIADTATPGLDNIKFGAVRRGPDNRIYVARDTCSYIGIIENPDDINCNFNAKGLYLEGTKSGWGLPIMMNYSIAPCIFAGYAGTDKNICIGGSVELGDLSIDTTNMSFEWSPKDGLDDPFIINPECSPGWTTRYVLMIKDEELGCVDYDTVLVNVAPPPHVISAEDQTTCANTKVTIGNDNNSDNFVYAWYPADYLTSPDSKITECTPPKDMQYILSVLDPNTGCYSYDTVEVRINELDNFDIVGSLYVCEGKSTTVSVKDDFASYYWSTGETTKEITILKPGFYNVTVTDASGCTGTKTIQIQTLASDNFNIIAPTHICLSSETVTTLSVNAEFAKYTWSTGETTRAISITSTGMYWVTVENEEGCLASDTVEITGTSIECALSLPEIVFSDLCESNSNPITNVLSNNGADAITISSIKFYNENTTDFKINSFEFPLIVEPNASIDIVAEVSNVLDGIYVDTLVIEITEPCESKIIVPMYASTDKNYLTLSSRSLEVEPGNAIDMPLIISKPPTFSSDEAFEFTIKCSVGRDMLNVSSVQGGTITDRTINGWRETLTISSEFPVNTDTVVIKVTADTYIGFDTIGTINYYDFKSKLSCVLADSVSSTVKLIGCNIPIRILKFFTLTDMTLEVESSSIACQVVTEEVGDFSVSLYDIAGNEVKRIIWNKTSKDVERKTFFIEDFLSPGCYIVSLKSPNYIVNKVCTLTR